MTSVQAAKAKASRWNRRVAEYMAQWWPYAEKRAPSGPRDKGDVAGTPVTVECKNEKGWGSKLAEYQNETLVERDNAGTDISFVAIPRKGKGVEQAYAVTTLEEMCELLWKAGYR